jgi:lipopolysaccharide/colanic/teichoic acid biosynthesis glycosyltransferase
LTRHQTLRSGLVRIRQREGHTDVLRRLRRSPRVARSIPAPLRVFDLVVVVLSLPLTLLLGTVIALAVFLDSPGPVFYRSRRIGRGGQAFDMLKFRTMVRDAGGPLLSAHSDERYTPLGRRLASSRLDELPQLWNVIRGEMRLVGPRPELADFVRDFPDEYEQILSVPPGLTGPAQLEYAWEGEILARAQAVDRVRLYRESILPLKLAIDIGYARRHSVGGDLVLLARTAVLPLVRAWRRVQAVWHDGTPRHAAMIASAAVLVTAVAVLAALLAAETSSPL